MSSLVHAKEDIIACLDKDRPVFVWGSPGVGKSDTIRAIKEEMKYDTLLDFRASLRSSVDLHGIPIPDLAKMVAHWIPPSDLPDEKRHGKKGILFLDELNVADPLVQAACYGLVLDRKVGEYTLPKGWRIVAAGNRQSDRSSARRMPRALGNRFTHIHVDVDPIEWANNYAAIHCHEYVEAFIRFKPGALFNMETGDEDEAVFPTPRSWTTASDFCTLPEAQRFRLISGTVGKAAAAEFEGYIKIITKLPDLDDVIADPKHHPLPDADEPSLRFAMACGLARYADRKNFKAVLTYAARLGREYEIVTVHDATIRNKALMSTTAYIEFAKRNKDLHIGSV